MIDHKELLVSVVCTTYNHEAYVRQTLEGFVMQKTNFSFEVIVHDDASTDSTVQIIKEYESKYPNLFRNIYQIENQYSQGKDIWGNLFCNYCAGKYIAICEGDDYWIDPLKLQKQVDFLEANPEYGLVHTSAKLYNLKNEKFQVETLGNAKNSFRELLESSSIATLTTCFRKELVLSYNNIIAPYSKGWLMGDYPMWLWCSLKSKIHFIPEVTSVYNCQIESASHSINGDKNVLFCFSAYEIFSFFSSRYLSQEYMNVLNNRKFILLFLTIMYNHSYHLLYLLVDSFKNQRLSLTLKNRMLFFIIKKVCWFVC